jgi:PAS domain S-box-containing protein
VSSTNGGSARGAEFLVEAAHIGGEVGGDLARTVLVVHDNADMREYIAGLLRPHFTVRTAVDGRDALQAARSDPPDLVLTDVMMPGLDGFGLIGELRADQRTALIPVIMLSARAGDGAVVEGLQAGADDYLVKPFSAAELLARVRTNLELARLRSQAISWRRVLMETIQDAMQIIDAEGYLVEVNDAFRELVGFPVVLPQAKPHPWWPDPETDPDDWAQVAAAHQAIRDNPSGRFTVPFRHADGSRLWVDVMYGSLVDPQTGQRLVMGTFRDVTARTRSAERAATLTRVTTRLAQITDVDAVLADGARELQAAVAASSVKLALVPENGPLRAVEAATAPDARAAAQLRKIAAARA